MQNHKPIKNKNQNLLFFFLRMKFTALTNKLCRNSAKRQHKGRFLIHVDFMKGLTPKKTEKTREIEGFTTSQAKFTTGPMQKSNPRARNSMNFTKTLDTNETSLDEDF